VFLLDWYANNSGFRNVHPGEKVLFTLVCLFLTIFFSRTGVSVSVLILTSVLLLLAARIPPRYYARLLLLPFSFLLVGSLAVALENSPSGSHALLSINLGWVYLGISRNSLNLAFSLMLRSLASVSSLYFLALTTPFSELGWLLRKIKVPPLVIELAALTYRFIFLLAETSGQIYTAQASRLGYSSWKNAFKSLGTLLASLYIKSFHRSQMFHLAMLSRCYDGEFRALEMRYKVSPANWLLITGMTFFLISIGRIFP